jgi:hypothetical protein
LFRTIFLILFLFSVNSLFSQWSLEVSSQVEKDGKGLGGATIGLYQGTKLLKEVTSQSNGDFTIEVPANGEFVIQVSYLDCNPKKFLVSTRGVPAEVAAENFMPSYRIGGFTMRPPLPTIDYSALQNPLLKIVYFASSGRFDHEDAYTEKMLGALSQIRDAEKALLEKQAAAVKEGDGALKKNECELAKTHYKKAIDLIPVSPYQDYSKTQLIKCDECINAAANEAKLAAGKEAAAKKAAEQKAADDKAKAEQEKLAKEKAEREKIAAAELKKAEDQKKAEEKAAQEKAREENERLAREKAEKDKSAAAEAKRLEDEKKPRRKRLMIKPGLSRKKLPEKTL